MQAYEMDLFFPSKENFRIIKEQLRRCRHSMYVCMFALSHKKMMRILIEQANQGRDVRVILNHQEDPQKNHVIYRLLKDSESRIKMAIYKREHIMHSKFWIIDGEQMGHGSANWTYQAFKHNHEEVLLSRNRTRIINYTKRFEDLWNSLDEVKLIDNQLQLFTREYEEPFVDLSELYPIVID